MANLPIYFIGLMNHMYSLNQQNEKKSPSIPRGDCTAQEHALRKATANGRGRALSI